MKELYIIGNSGFSKEVYELSLHLKEFVFKGFIDYDPKQDYTEIGNKKYAVYKESEFLLNKKPNEDIVLALGVGNPRIISKIIERFNAYSFPNLIHPNAVFNSSLNILGKGNIITANTVFTVNVEVGNYNIFNLSTTVGHDCKIGNCNVINPTVNVSGGVCIGDRNLLGVNSTILQYLKIENDCIIGASSLVTKNIEDGKTVVGIPAKVLKA